MYRVGVLTLRAGKVIGRVKRLIRTEEPHRSTCDLNEAVSEIIALMEHEARINDVAIRLELAEDLLPVLVDSIQIQQVVLNLARNALEAMEQVESTPREVTIRPLSSATVPQTAEAESKWVKVSVSDTGPGLPTDRIKDVFVPFMTTKSKGLGMGLSISRTIIEAHAGRLWAEPNAQRGYNLSVCFARGVHGSRGQGSTAHSHAMNRMDIHGLSHGS